jgi:hypothetical protein
MNKCICGEEYLKEDTFKILNYSLCKSCGIVIKMLIEGFLEERAKKVGNKFKRTVKDDDIKTDIILKNNERCVECSFSFVDMLNKKISCVSDKDPNTCGGRG